MSEEAKKVEGLEPEVLVEQEETKEVETAAETAEGETAEVQSTAAAEEEMDEATKAEMAEKQRLVVVEGYNKNNLGRGTWCALEKPTEQEVEEFYEYVDKATKEFNASTFEIADAANAKRVATFLKKWNEEDVIWEGNMWKGTIAFDAAIKVALEKLKEKEEPLVFDWQNLMYVHMAMNNLRGRGLKSAEAFSHKEEEYEKIHEVVKKYMEDYNEKGKKIQAMQQQHGAWDMGYKMYIEGGEWEKHLGIECPEEYRVKTPGNGQ